MVQRDKAVCPRTTEETKVGPGKRTIHVFAVDDEEDIRQVIRALLEAAGYSVIVAEGGPMALKLAQDFPGRLLLGFDRRC